MFQHYYTRSIFAKFCCGILPLRVQTGRRQRVTDDKTGQTRSLKLEDWSVQIASLAKAKNNVISC